MKCKYYSKWFLILICKYKLIKSILVEEIDICNCVIIWEGSIICYNKEFLNFIIKIRLNEMFYIKYKIIRKYWYVLFIF